MGVRRWLMVSVIGVAAAQISRGIISAFSWDLFADCIDGTKAPTDFACEYQPQIMVNLLAALLFFAIGFALLVKTTRMWSAMWNATMAVAFFVLLMAMWRWEIALSDNFLLYAGPETFIDYMYLLLLGVDTLLVTTVMALFYNFGEAMNNQAKPNRKEPRVSFKK